MRDSELRTQQRIQTIIKIIEQCGFNGANKERLIAQFMVNNGIARRTMLEYLQALKLTDRIKEVGENLFIKLEGAFEHE